MKFQHTSPLPAGISTMDSTAMIGVPQMATVAGNSGATKTIIPGDLADTLSINLLQLVLTWGGVTSLGKFVIASKDTNPLTIFQDRPNGSLVVPLWNIMRYLGTFGLLVQNNSTGGEYSIIVNYIVREL